MLSDERMLGDRERPELGVEMLSEEVRRFLLFKCCGKAHGKYTISPYVCKRPCFNTHPRMIRSCL